MKLEVGKVYKCSRFGDIVIITKFFPSMSQYKFQDHKKEMYMENGRNYHDLDIISEVTDETIIKNMREKYMVEVKK